MHLLPHCWINPKSCMDLKWSVKSLMQCLRKRTQLYVRSLFHTLDWIIIRQTVSLGPKEEELLTKDQPVIYHFLQNIWLWHFLMKDSLYIFFNIFIWMCFYCAIFDGISVFRKKKRKKTQEKKIVGESSCQHSKSLLCKMYFCPGFECGIMSLNEQRISKRSLRLPLVKFAFLGLVQEYALKVSRFLTPWVTQVTYHHYQSLVS